MILKLIIKTDKKTGKNKIVVWIQKGREFERDVQQLFEFFKDSVQIQEKFRFSRYYKVTSDNPAIMLSLFSSLQEIIPDIYFQPDPSESIEEIEHLIPSSDAEHNF